MFSSPNVSDRLPRGGAGSPLSPTDVAHSSMQTLLYHQKHQPGSEDALSHQHAVGGGCVCVRVWWGGGVHSMPRWMAVDSQQEPRSCWLFLFCRLLILFFLGAVAVTAAAQHESASAEVGQIGRKVGAFSR